MIAPIVVLVAICLVASAMLAGVFKVASPIIEARSEAASTEARSAVLPEGNAFTKWDGELVEGVNDAYTADNGAGMVFSTSFNGFNGAVELMIGMNAEGAVTGIQVMSQSETPGVGSNALTDAYLGKFTGQTSAEGIDAYSGATFTSKAVKNSVNAAASQFALISGKQSESEMTEDELIAQAIGFVFPKGDSEKLKITNPVEGVLSVYSNEARDAFAMLVEKVGYNKEDVVRVVVGIDANGAVTFVTPVYQKEVAGIGDTALSDDKFLAQFVGITEIGKESESNEVNGEGSSGNTENAANNESFNNSANENTVVLSASTPAKKGSDAVTVDAVSNATETCNAVIEAVRAALTQYAAIN